MNYFFITSALNTPFGVFPSEVREDQLIQTVSSIKRVVSNSKVIILESSPLKINLKQETLLLDIADELFIYSDDPHLQQCYRRWNIEPIHKNLGETWCMHRALKEFPVKHDDVVVKLSGRYRLQDSFQLAPVKDKIMLCGPHPTGFPEEMCDIKFWYISRLLYWEGSNQSFMENAYLNMHNTILDHVGVGKYTDVEHCLYSCISDDMIQKIDPGNLHIEGELAATGEKIID